MTSSDTQTIQFLVAHYGLRPVVNAVGQAALELLAEGKPVLDESGCPMDEGDIQTAAGNLINGDLY